MDNGLCKVGIWVTMTSTTTVEDWNLITKNAYSFLPGFQHVIGNIWKPTVVVTYDSMCKTPITKVNCNIYKQTSHITTKSKSFMAVASPAFINYK